MRPRSPVALAFCLALCLSARAAPVLSGPPPELARYLPAARPLRLAEELLVEADYPAASLEARRVALEARDPFVRAKASLVRALADLRRADAAPGAGEEALAALERLWQGYDGGLSAAEAADFGELRAFAACELGRARMARAKGSPDALPPLEHAFLRTRNPALFRLAGCSLDFLFSENPDLADEKPDLARQVAFSLSAWPPSVRELADPRALRRRTRPSLVDWPARAFIAFYRTQIGPAIGNRCSLEPSCSEYFLRACKKHGLLGVPLIGDRFIRESAVTQAAEVTVERADGSVRIADPVSDHDFWFASSP